MANTGIQLGEDLLVGVVQTNNFLAFGHSTTCKISNKSDTKDISVKPTLIDKAAAGSAGLWKKKKVTGVSVTITADGLVCYDEPEEAYSKLYAAWLSGSEVTARYATRGEQTATYNEGQFVITQLDQTGDTGDNSTYSITLENTGEVKSVIAAGG